MGGDFDRIRTCDLPSRGGQRSNQTPVVVTRYYTRSFEWAPNLLAALYAYGYGYGYSSAGGCTSYAPGYDAYGNYIGRRLVNGC